MKNLPPLRAIVAFEACYRLRSFTRAAASLNVRQPAISHQIRILEEDLGAKLFQRQGARIAPTGEADEFFRAVSSGLSEIVRGSTEIRSRSGDDTMNLATYTGIAAFWLLPRLARTATGGDKPPFRVTTAERDTDIPLNETDAAILFGRGNWPGFESILLFNEQVVPLASPSLAEEWRGRDGARPPAARSAHSSGGSRKALVRLGRLASSRGAGCRAIVERLHSNQSRHRHSGGSFERRHCARLVRCHRRTLKQGRVGRARRRTSKLGPRLLSRSLKPSQGHPAPGMAA